MFFYADIMQRFRVGSDGRTVYELITEHKFRSLIIGFGESFNYIIETGKWAMHRADSHMHHAIFLGYIWRITECLVGNRDGMW